MSEKERARVKRKRLVKEVRKRSLVTKVMQDCPWTAVQLELGDGNRVWLSYGFSKVCYPDEWDEDFGFDLAIEKAASKIAKQLVQYYGVKL